LRSDSVQVASLETAWLVESDVTPVKNRATWDTVTTQFRKVKNNQFLPSGKKVLLDMWLGMYVLDVAQFFIGVTSDLTNHILNLLLTSFRAYSIGALLCSQYVAIRLE